MKVRWIAKRLSDLVGDEFCKMLFLCFSGGKRSSIAITSRTQMKWSQMNVVSTEVVSNEVVSNECGLK